MSEENTYKHSSSFVHICFSHNILLRRLSRLSHIGCKNRANSKLLLLNKRSCMTISSTISNNEFRSMLSRNSNTRSRQLRHTYRCVCVIIGARNAYLDIYVWPELMNYLLLCEFVYLLMWLVFCPAKEHRQGAPSYGERCTQTNRVTASFQWRLDWVIVCPCAVISVDCWSYCDWL